MKPDEVLNNPLVMRALRQRGVDVADVDLDSIEVSNGKNGTTNLRLILKPKQAASPANFTMHLPGAGDDG